MLPLPPVGTAEAAAAKYFRKMLKMKRLRHQMACETLKILASEAMLRRSHLEQEMRSKGFNIPPLPFQQLQHSYSALDATSFLCTSSSEEDRWVWELIPVHCQTALYSTGTKEQNNRIIRKIF